jgi:hypothetical protein
MASVIQPTDYGSTGYAHRLELYHQEALRGAIQAYRERLFGRRHV